MDADRDRVAACLSALALACFALDQRPAEQPLPEQAGAVRVVRRKLDERELGHRGG